MHLIGLDQDCATITSSERGPHSHIWMRIRKWDTGRITTLLSMLISGDVVTEVHIPETAQRRRAGFHRAELLQVLYDAIAKNPHLLDDTKRYVRNLATWFGLHR